MTVINISDSEDASAPDSWFYYFFAIVGFLIMILICARLIFSRQSPQVEEGQTLKPGASLESI